MEKKLHKELPTNLLRLLSLMSAELDPEKVRTIVEVGARDCKESLLFENLFPLAQIYVFECNERTLQECRDRTLGHDRITLIEEAITNVDGMVSFFPINQKETITTWVDGNPGASSLLRASNTYPIEKYVQDETTVLATTLKTFMEKYGLSNIDLLWMDIQGAELLALKGAGKSLSKIKLVHVEVEFFQIYKEQPLFQEIYTFLKSEGFIFAGFSTIGQYAADAIFIKHDRISSYFQKLRYSIFGMYQIKKHRLSIILGSIKSLLLN